MVVNGLPSAKRINGLARMRPRSSACPFPIRLKPPRPARQMTTGGPGRANPFLSALVEDQPLTTYHCILRQADHGGVSEGRMCW